MRWVRPRALHTFTFAAAAGLLLAAVPAGSTRRAPSQEGESLAPKGYEVRTRIHVPVDRPTLADIEIEYAGTLQATSLAGDQAARLDAKTHLQFVDEYHELTDDKERATRKIVLERTTTNGETYDGVYSGIVAHYTRENDDVEVELDGDRGAVGRDLNWLLRGFDSLGVWLGFPKKVDVGSSFDLDFSPLVAVVSMGDMDVKSAKARMRLDSYDKVSSTARFSGDVKIEQSGFFEGSAVRASIDAKLSIATDLQESLIEEITLDGTYRMSSRGSASLSSDGKYKCTLTTKIGKAAERARKKKTKFRQRLYRMPRLGVQFRLPTYYSRVRSEEKGDALFVRTLDLDRGRVYVQLKIIEASSANPNLYYDKLEASLRGEYASLKKIKRKCPLGKGCAYFIANADSGLLFQSELYPWKGKFVMFKLYGPPKAYRKAFREFEKARRTLRPLGF